MDFLSNAGLPGRKNPFYNQTPPLDLRLAKIRSLSCGYVCLSVITRFSWLIL
jgi:hypothetical protein